jgi:hypothetical protein
MALAEEQYREIRDKVRWIESATRMAAIHTFAFSNTLRVIEALGRNCPSLMSRVDQDARKRAENKFHRAFPRLEEIRDSAAHPGEMNNSPNSHAKNAETIGPGGTYFVGGSVEIGDDRARFEASFRRERVAYELSTETVGTLKEIATEYWAAFIGAEHPDSAKRREEMRQAGFPTSAPR